MYSQGKRSNIKLKKCYYKCPIQMFCQTNNWAGEMSCILVHPFIGRCWLLSLKAKIVCSTWDFTFPISVSPLTVRLMRFRKWKWRWTNLRQWKWPLYKKKSHLSLPIKVCQFLFNFLLSLFHLTLPHSPSFPQHLQGKRKHDRRTCVVRDLPLR